MTFYQLYPTGDFSNEDLCVIEGVPEEIERYSFKLCFGKTVADIYPEDARVYLSDDNPGVKVSDIVGNTNSNIIVKEKVKNIVQAECGGVEIEYLPFTLINHKGKPHSDTLYFINPIGGYDCLNKEASGITYLKSGEVDEIERLILSEMKLKNAPHLFRIPEEPTVYVISQHLFEVFEKQGVTNLEIDGLTSR